MQRLVRNNNSRTRRWDTFKGTVFALLCLCCLAVLGEGSGYVKYKDSKKPLNVRIEDLMRRMTLEEKIARMAQIERWIASYDVMKNYYIGSVLSGGGSVPQAQASAKDWIAVADEF